MGTLGRAIFTVGKWIRGTGQAMDRLGSTIQGGLRVEEQGKRPPPPAPSLSPSPPSPRPTLWLFSLLTKDGSSPRLIISMRRRGSCMPSVSSCCSSFRICQSQIRLIQWRPCSSLFSHLGLCPKGENKAEIVFVKDGLAMDMRNVV